MSLEKRLKTIQDKKAKIEKELVALETREQMASAEVEKAKEELSELGIEYETVEDLEMILSEKEKQAEELISKAEELISE